MPRKNVVIAKIASAQSLSSNFTTNPTVIQYLDNCSYQINITTTDSVGTFAVQASNDYAEPSPSTSVTNAGNWITLNLGGGTPNANAANDNILIELNQVPFKAIRLAYTSTTPGTGVCDVYVSGKEIGG